MFHSCFRIMLRFCKADFKLDDFLRSFKGGVSLGSFLQSRNRCFYCPEMLAAYFWQSWRIEEQDSVSLSSLGLDTWSDVTLSCIELDKRSGSDVSLSSIELDKDQVYHWVLEDWTLITTAFKPSASSKDTPSPSLDLDQFCQAGEQALLNSFGGLTSILATPLLLQF